MYLLRITAFIGSNFWCSEFYNIYSYFKQLVFLQNDCWMCGLVTGYPDLVISHGLDMAVEHCSGCWSAKFQLLHHDSSGLCILATSTSQSGFCCHQLCLNSWCVDSRSCVVTSSFLGHFSYHVTFSSLLNPWRRFWACCLTTAIMDFICMVLFLQVHPSHPLSLILIFMD
jgi:hypothetical protein